MEKNARNLVELILTDILPSHGIDNITPALTLDIGEAVEAYSKEITPTQPRLESLDTPIDFTAMSVYNHSNLYPGFTGMNSKRVRKALENEDITTYKDLKDRVDSIMKNNPSQIREVDNIRRLGIPKIGPASLEMIYAHCDDVGLHLFSGGYIGRELRLKERLAEKKEKNE